VVPVKVFIDLSPLPWVLGIPMIGELPCRVDISQNSMTLEKVKLSVSDGGHLRIRVDFLELRRVLLHFKYFYFFELEGDFVYL